MNDVTTNEPLRVLADGTSGGMISMPYSQLDDVRRLLDGHDIYYWVDEHVVSFDGSPEYAFVFLGHSASPTAVQTILDSES